MRTLSLALVLVSGCAFDLDALHGTGLGDAGIPPLGDAAVVIGDDASLADVPMVVVPDAGSDAGSDAPPPWVDRCPSGRAADCCEGAYCSRTGVCFRVQSGCGVEGAYCCPGFGCVAGLRCVGLGIHAWEDTCEVDPDPPGPTVPPEC